MIVLNAWITWVWISSYGKIWYPPLTPLFLCGWQRKKQTNKQKKQNEKKIDWVDTKTFGEKTAPAIRNKQDHHP